MSSTNPNPPPAHSHKPPHIVIIGGSITGLTLALALSHARIPFTLLDRQPSLTHRPGASIAFFPNGARILDQLGVFAPLWEHTVPITAVHEHDERGALFRTKTGDVYEWLKRRTGFGVPFLCRKVVLEMLCAAVGERGSGRVLTGKRIVGARATKEGVSVVCESGEVYEGDVLAGCDGVNSLVRREMWRVAGEELGVRGVPEGETPLEG